MDFCIQVKVHTRAKRPGVEQISASEFKVRVTAPPDKGQANREVIKRLADFFNLPPSSLTIIRGQTAPHKIIKIKT